MVCTLEETFLNEYNEHITHLHGFDFVMKHKQGGKINGGICFLLKGGNNYNVGSDIHTIQADCKPRTGNCSKSDLFRWSF